jgi:hypothetical protein
MKTRGREIFRFIPRIAPLGFLAGEIVRCRVGRLLRYVI